MSDKCWISGNDAAEFRKRWTSKLVKRTCETCNTELQKNYLCRSSNSNFWPDLRVLIIYRDSRISSFLDMDRGVRAASVPKVVPHTGRSTIHIDCVSAELSNAFDVKYWCEEFSHFSVEEVFVVPV